MIRASVVAVVITGPPDNLEYVSDTVDSVCHYLGPSRRIVVVDNSQKGNGEVLKARFPEIDVVKTPYDYGRRGLYLTESLGYLHALRCCEFDCVLRVDSDAMLIGPRPEEAAARYFSEHPAAAMIGSWKIDCNGASRDYTWAAQKVVAQTSLRYLRQHLGQWRGIWLLHRIYRRALANGYDPGEHVMGGAAFLSRAFLQKLARRNLLQRTELIFGELQDDMLFGVMAYAVGMHLADFATGDLPLGVRWRGLPCSPQELIARDKKVIHSTRFWQDMDEAQIREFFRTLRLPNKSVG